MSMRPTLRARGRGEGKRRRGKVARDVAERLGLPLELLDALPPSVIEHAQTLPLPPSHAAIDPRSRELIGLVLAARIQCAQCIDLHAHAARFFGATDEQLRAARAMGAA